MLSRLQKVVLPDELGPVMSTMGLRPLLFSQRAKMSSAICTIFFSCSASDTCISSDAYPRCMALFTSPALDSRMMMSQRVFSANMPNVLGWSTFSASRLGLFQSGMRSSSPCS